MFWASRRVTKRREDEAYCLMGLFDVSMPPLYREGPKAFLRLQLEIINQADDKSIFVWEKDLHLLGQQFRTLQEVGKKLCNGLLADSASGFSNSGDIVRMMNDLDREPPRMTNRDLLIRFPAESTRIKPYTQNFSDWSIVPLNCGRLSKYSVLNGSEKFTESARCIALAVLGEFDFYRRLHRLYIMDPYDERSMRLGPNMYFRQTRMEQLQTQGVRQKVVFNFPLMWENEFELISPILDFHGLKARANLTNRWLIRSQRPPIRRIKNCVS